MGMLSMIYFRYIAWYFTLSMASLFRLKFLLRWHLLHLVFDIRAEMMRILLFTRAVRILSILTAARIPHLSLLRCRIAQYPICFSILLFEAFWAGHTSRLILIIKSRITPPAALPQYTSISFSKGIITFDISILVYLSFEIFSLKLTWYYHYAAYIFLLAMRRVRIGYPRLLVSYFISFS